MKKLLSVFILLSVLLSSTHMFASATTSPKNVSEKQLSQEEFSRIEKRAKEIRGMNFKNMSVSERQALKSEVMSMKQIISGPSGGLYISAGALIVILILLIILL